MRGLRCVEVKRPGDAAWLSPDMKDSKVQYTAVITPACPKGVTGEALLVSPSDRNNGAK